MLTVEIVIKRGDTVILRIPGNALAPVVWNGALNNEIVEGAAALYGFTYSPDAREKKPGE